MTIIDDAELMYYVLSHGCDYFIDYTNWSVIIKNVFQKYVHQSFTDRLADQVNIILDLLVQDLI